MVKLIKEFSLLLVLFTVCSCSLIPENETTVVQINMKLYKDIFKKLLRHGVRAWLRTYPNESLPISIWDKEGGFGQLTATGKQEIVEFANFFKETYQEVDFEANDVIARTTCCNRTIDSVQLFLFTLFNEKINTTCNRKSKIIHNKAYCPRYTQLREWSRNTSEYKETVAENSEFIQNMSRLSGIVDLNYYHMWEIADHILVNEAHGLELDDWVLENKKQILIANDHTFYIDFVTLEMAKLISGGILNNIVLNMKRQVSGKSSYQLNVYGIHDNVLAGMQKLLETSDEFENPNFASAYVFELRRDAQERYYVQVLHKNNKYPDEEIKLSPVSVLDCGFICPIDKFFKLTRDRLVKPAEYQEACELV